LRSTCWTMSGRISFGSPRSTGSAAAASPRPGTTARGRSR
jgi:hypothetical protein